MSELPEKIIVSKGCHDCPFSNIVRWCDRLMIDILDFAESELRPKECPLLTHTIRVIKND